MKKQNYLFTAVLILCLFSFPADLFAGYRNIIQAYPGKRLDPKKVAIIEDHCLSRPCLTGFKFLTKSGRAKDPVPYLLSVDGVPRKPRSVAFEVLPGKKVVIAHILVNRFGMIRKVLRQRIVFEAKPGHRYKLGGWPWYPDPRFVYWIIDLTEGKYIHGLSHEQLRRDKETKKLFTALKKGKTKKALKLIVPGKDYNAPPYPQNFRNKYHSFLGAAACCTNDPSAIKKLLQHGADINRAQLHLIAKEKDKHNFKVFKFLVENGANIYTGFHNRKKRRIDHSLRLAQDKKREKKVALLKKHHEMNVAMRNAIIKNDLGKVKQIIDEGLPIHTRINGRLNSIMFATSKGALDIVKYLHQQGAKLDSTSTIRIRTVNSRATFSPIHVAAMLGHTDLIEYMVKNGISVNSAIPGHGYTPLSFTIMGNKPMATKLLLSLGADINNQANTDYSTPLIQAVNRNNPEMVRLLLDNGAQTDAIDWRGRSALDIATRNKQQEIIDLLKSKGAKPSWQGGGFNVKVYRYKY